MSRQIIAIALLTVACSKDEGDSPTEADTDTDTDADTDSDADTDTDSDTDADTDSDSDTDTDTDPAEIDPVLAERIAFGPLTLAGPNWLSTSLGLIDLGDGPAAVTVGTDTTGVSRGHIAVTANVGGVLDGSTELALVARNTTKHEVGDLDGDGDDDLVLASVGDIGAAEAGGLAILLGGGGTLSDPGALRATTSAHPSDVESGDLDGDGDLDLVVHSQELGLVEVMLGNGDGTFADGVLVPMPAPFQADLDLGDVDGDGDLDLVVVLAADDQGFNLDSVAVLAGNGDGTFGAGVEVVPFSVFTAFSLSLGDLDADGNLDVVVGAALGSVSVHWGDGTGAFPDSVMVNDLAGTWVQLADADGDGNLDLVTKGPTAGAMVIGYGDGARGVPERQELQFQLVSGFVSVTVYELVDLDGDGSLDFAATGTAATVGDPAVYTVFSASQVPLVP